VTDEDDDTLVPGEDDRTVVVQRDEVIDRTVVIDRRRPSRPQPPSVRTIPDPPAGPGPERAAGTVQDYPARALPLLPTPAPLVLRGEDARGRASTALPSVRRRSRRAAVATLLAFAVACAVSVVGVVAVIVWFVRA